MLFLAQGEEVSGFGKITYPWGQGYTETSTLWASPGTELQPQGRSTPCHSQAVDPAAWTLTRLELRRQCHTQPRWSKSKQLLLVTSHCPQICFPSPLARALIIPAADPAGKQLCMGTRTQSKGRATSQHRHLARNANIREGTAVLAAGRQEDCPLWKCHDLKMTSGHKIAEPGLGQNPTPTTITKLNYWQTTSATRTPGVQEETGIPSSTKGKNQVEKNEKPTFSEEQVYDRIKEALSTAWVCKSSKELSCKAQTLELTISSSLRTMNNFMGTKSIIFNNCCKSSGSWSPVCCHQAALHYVTPKDTKNSKPPHKGN